MSKIVLILLIQKQEKSVRTIKTRINVIAVGHNMCAREIKIRRIVIAAKTKKKGDKSRNVMNQVDFII